MRYCKMKKFINIMQGFCLVLLFWTLSSNSVVAYTSDHVWGPWMIGKQPTCIEEGYRYRICTHIPGDPHQQEEAIPKLEQHSYFVTTVIPSCVKEGTTTHTCEYCGYTYTEKSPALGHEYGDWVLIRTATTAEEGLMEKVCTHDNHHVIQKTLPIIVAVEETFAPVPTPPVTNVFVINTMDIVLSSSLIFLIILVLVIVSLNIYILRWHERKKKDYLAQGGIYHVRK